MMDHKTMLNRTAKANIQLMLAEIPDERKNELIKKYYNPEKCLKSTNSQKILIGNWFNNATRMLQKGATEEELNRVIEHIVVLLHAVKRNLDIQRSYKDHDLFGLTKKYFGVYKKVQLEDGEIILEKEIDVLEKRRKMIEKKEKRRKELKEKIQNMLDSGCDYSYIADELAMPESTVRNIMKYHD